LASATARGQPARQRRAKSGATNGRSNVHHLGIPPAALAAGAALFGAAPAGAQTAPPPPAASGNGSNGGAGRRASNGDLVQGFSRERLGPPRPAFAREAERGSFPGCVALIARSGQIVHHEAYGHQDAARTKRMARDAIFLQASMTKPVTSVAAMMLVEEGG
jgi:CubicO group peptidase (beta-lactamase class C family)